MIDPTFEMARLVERARPYVPQRITLGTIVLEGAAPRLACVSIEQHPDQEGDHVRRQDDVEGAAFMKPSRDKDETV